MWFDMAFRNTFKRHPVLFGGILYGLVLVTAEATRDIFMGREISPGELLENLIIAVLVGCCVTWVARRMK